MHRTSELILIVLVSQSFLTKIFFKRQQPITLCGKMNKKLFILFALAFVLVFVSFPQIQKVQAQTTIYIRSDGTVEGTDANSDGIIDVPLELSGENIDNYPLLEQVEIQTIPEFSLLTVLSLIPLVSLVVLVFRRTYIKHQ
jgi:hypothetical protein